MKKTLLLILFCSFIYASKGQLVVTKGTFPPICNGVTTYYNQLTDIIIAETNSNDFGTGLCSFTIQSVPFTIFNSGIGQVQFAVNGDITTGSISVCCNQIISVNFTVSSNTKIDTIRIKGLQLKTIIGAPSSFDVTKQSTFSCTQNGFAVGQSVMTVNTSNNIADFTLPFAQQFCPNSAPYLLVGNPVGGVFSGTGVIGNYFYPANVIAGSHPITYTLSNACNTSITKSASIVPLNPILTTNKDSICQGQSITFTALGGSSPYTFYKNNVIVQGPGTNNKYITTQLAQGDAVFVASTYSGCTNYSDTLQIPVNANPIVNFTISDYCAGKLPNTFTSTSLIPYGSSTISKIEWYADVSTYYPNGNSIAHKFTAAGNHSLKEIVTLNTGCSAFKDSTFYMGPFPFAHYKWLNVCGTNDVNYIDTSKISSGSIVQWNWDFDTGSALDINSSTQNPSYTFPSPYSYNSRLIVTSDLGCKDTLTRRIITLQGVTITKSNPYVGDFNVSKSGWDFGDDSLTTWGWGTFTPSTLKHNQIISNQNIWHTANTATYEYNTNERSFLNSPCFNFQNLTKPMIAIKMAMDTDPTTAGAIIEASTDGGVIWNRIGSSAEEGVDWYNNSGNDGRPGGFAKYPDNLVWSGHYDTISAANIFSGWKVAKIKLDTLAGLNSVRFRIAFGAANSGVSKYTGIAIDSIWIGDRNKILVLENFTNKHIIPDIVGTPLLQAKNAVDYICDQRKKDVAPIYFHCTNPIYKDSYNSYYPQGPSSRIFYYGFSDIPATVLDGNYYKGNVYSGGTASSRLDLEDVDSRILERAKFRIDLSTDITPGNVAAKIKVIYIDPASDYNDYLTLQTVVTEDSADGDNRFSYVARQMLPDAAGEGLLKGSWTFNDSLMFSRSWNHSLPSNKFGVIAFLQTSTSKEILQSVYVKGTGNSGAPVVLDISDKITKNESILIFPNPANNEVNVISLSDDKQITNYTLIDNLGRELITENLGNGERSIVLNTNDINSGLYYIRVSLSNGVTTLNKILINH